MPPLETMPVIAVDSLEDPRVAIYRDLKSAFAKRRQSLFVVEGLTLAERLLASDIAIHSVLTEPRYVERLLPKMPPDAPLYVAGRRLVEELAGFRFHRGVLACGYRPAARELKAVMGTAPPVAVVAVCVGIQDPENVGGVMRTSAAFGAASVLLGPNCADPFSRRVARTSMGANFSLPVVESVDLRADLETLRCEFGFELVATVLDRDALPLERAPRPRRVVLLFGNEGAGLDRCWVEMCDHRVTISMRSGVDSLNVSVAAGIFLHWFAVRDGSIPAPNGAPGPLC